MLWPPPCSRLSTPLCRSGFWCSSWYCSCGSPARSRNRPRISWSLRIKPTGSTRREPPSTLTTRISTANSTDSHQGLSPNGGGAGGNFWREQRLSLGLHPRTSEARPWSTQRSSGNGCTASEASTPCTRSLQLGAPEEGETAVAVPAAEPHLHLTNLPQLGQYDAPA